MLCLRAQVEALVKRNHERAAEARSAFLPLLHRDMLDAAPHGPSNGLSAPAIKVRALNCNGPCPMHPCTFLACSMLLCCTKPAHPSASLAPRISQ